MENFFFALAVIVLTVAAVCFISAAADYFLQSKVKPIFTFSILEVTNPEELEWSVRRFVRNAGKSSCLSYELVLVLEDDASEELLKICEGLCKDYSAVGLCTKKNLSDYLKGRFYF